MTKSPIVESIDEMDISRFSNVDAFEEKLYSASIIGSKHEKTRGNKTLSKALDQIENNWCNFDISEAIKKMGDSHRYQYVIFFNAVLVLFSASFTVFSLGYIGNVPTPHCL